ncbi:MAG TPA: YlbF family regulator [Tissierellia bacterium]|jgi:cell fate (sporulation/competence/biofilm development) regulator YlbF (YheA/YmcA/DUF963 family)|nr:YlbF family regulator [Tissierellia bacterium]
MNPYDKARELAKAIEESPQYKNFQEAKKLIEDKPSAKKMVEDFQKKQLEYQRKALSGEEDPEAENKLKELYAALSLDSDAANFMNTEFSLGQMLQEIMKILSDVLER